MRVLAIDNGFTLGYGALGRSYVRSGSHKLAGSAAEMGVAFRAQRERVLRLAAEHRPDVIVTAKLFRGTSFNAGQNSAIVGFTYRLQEIADELGLPFMTYYEHDARKALLSPATVPRKSAAVKSAVHTAITGLGWPATDFNASDALCMAKFAFSVLDKEWAHRMQPLFAGAKPRRGANRNHAWAG